MDSSTIQLPGSEIAGVTLEDGRLRVAFSRAYIIKTMTGSAEKTRWWQAGELIMDGAEAQTPLPSGRFVCDGGDIDENIYTYRDMIPIPLDSRGRTRCALRVRDTGSTFIVHGETVRLVMRDSPRYIEHLRD